MYHVTGTVWFVTGAGFTSTRQLPTVVIDPQVQGATTADKAIDVYLDLVGLVHVEGSPEINVSVSASSLYADSASRQVIMPKVSHYGV